MDLYEIINIVKESIFDIGSFVFISLVIYIFIKDKIRGYLGSRKGLLLASMLGALPGCGGTISVTIFYLEKLFTPGMLVAGMAATMGDGAFLLLGNKPILFLGLTTLTLVTGIILGFLVDFFKLFENNKFKEKPKNHPELLSEIKNQNTINKWFAKYGYWLFFGLMTIVFLLQLTFIFGLINKEKMTWLIVPLATIIVILVLWNFVYAGIKKICLHHFEPTCHKEKFEDVFRRASHIFFFLILGVIIFNLFKPSFLDINKISTISNQLILILVCGFVGFIPGSGSQMVITSLFLQGALPLSALMVNMIVSSGEASYLLLINNKRNLIFINFTLLIVGSLLSLVVMLF